MDAGDKIKITKGKFNFGGKISKQFDKHVKKSVPLYDIGHHLTCKLSSFFIDNGSMAYDLGCSTGTLIKKICKYNQHINFKIKGIDREKNMIKKKKKNNKNNKKISFSSEKLENVKLKKSDFVVSYYTIQFIKPKYRQKVYNEIYKSLNWSGGFVLFEKVRSPDARFQDLMTQVYSEYKNDVGYNEKQIYHKAVSIRGFLEPFTSTANKAYLKRAGFKDILTIQKYGPFEGILAIK